MKNILKKTIAATVALVMVFASCITGFAESDYTVADAYAECCEIYPEFAENVKAQGATDEQIIVFLESIYEYLLNYADEITEDNFDGYALDAVNDAIGLRKNITVRNAILKAYPDASVDALDGKIGPEFMPLYETAKALIFNHGMLGGESSEPTDETTIAPTEAPTSAPTAAPTEAPTSAPTEAPTSAPTEEPTSAPTEEPTTAPSNAAGNETETSSEASTAAPAEDATDDADTAENDEPSAPTVPGSTEPSDKPTSLKFTDMGSAAWAEEAVYALVEMGIISGYGDGTFLPNKSITRAEFAKIIVMASGRYDANATADFKDVKSSDWYYSYVASAKNLGLVNGRDDGSFDPNSNITRADICTIVYRYIKSVNPEFGKDAGATSFSDFAKVPSYAQDAVKALSAAGIVSGMGNNKFEPLSNATRAQSAKIVYGAIKAALQI